MVQGKVEGVDGRVIPVMQIIACFLSGCNHSFADACSAPVAAASSFPIDTASYEFCLKR